MEVSPKLVEVNVCDTATEFDWRDYNYEDNLYVPGNLDDNSDEDDFDAWNNIVNRRKEELLLEENLEDVPTSSSVASSADSGSRKTQRPGTPILDSSFNRRTPPRVHFKQSIEELFHKHRPYNRKLVKKAGILKHNAGIHGKDGGEALQMGIGENVIFVYRNENDKATNTKQVTVQQKRKNDEIKLPPIDVEDDLAESIRQFDKYISEKVVRFAKRNKESKIKYLWSNLDVENRAQWEQERRRRRRQALEKNQATKSSSHNTAQPKEETPADEGDQRKREIHLPLIKCSPNYKTIRRFEKRNVTRTISKLGDLESLFIKNKPPQSDAMSNSDGDVELSDEEGVVPRNARTERRGSLRADSTEALKACHRGVRLKRAIRKVQNLLAAEKGNKLRNSIQTLIEENRNAERTRNKPSPLERFRHAGRLIILMLRAVGMKPQIPEDSDYNFLSWTILYDEMGISRTPYDPSGLMFDPQKFKASKESFLSHDVEVILLKQPSERTDAQIQQVIRFLSQVVPAFGEYPMRIQRSTLKCCTLERFEAGRVIIRQGHRAENFYFIISGTAVVTVMESGANHVHTVNSLTSGNSFGELAFLNMSQRTATVTCRENMELLCIEREDFIEIFMRRIKGQEPEHMTFLRNVDLLKGWPIERLPLDNLRICAFTYVRRGIILSADSSKSDWLFVVVSGTCKVLKALVDLDVSKDKQTNHTEVFQLPFYVKRQVPEIKTGMENSQSDASYQDERQVKGRGRSKFTVLQPPPRQPSAIDMIVNRSFAEVELSKEEHLNQLESIYQKLHVLPAINNTHERLESTSTDGNDSNSRTNSSIISGKENDNGEVIAYRKAEKAKAKARARSEKMTKTENPSLGGRQQPHHVLFAPPVQLKPSSPSQFLRETSQNFGIQRSARSAARRLVLQSPGPSTVHAWNTGRQVKKVFIEVARLEPGDVFGIEQLVMNGREEVTSTSLVSDGAEVIIIDKKFFRKHLTEETAKRIRTMIRPVPSESALQQNFIDQKHWDAYKTKTLEGYKARPRRVQ